MRKPRAIFLAVATAVAAAAVAPRVAAAQHKCDPVTDEGWSVVPARETISVKDGTPYQAGTGRSWFIDRVTTVLPFCHYFNSIGIYSMRSYSLSPVETQERVAICQDDGKGGSIPVSPYAGPCPPAAAPAR